MQVTYKVYRDSAALAEATAAFMAQEMVAAATQRGVARVAISGGNTPRATFDLLAAKHASDVPWDKLQLFFVDERTVPPDDKDSNYRMTRESLLSKVPVPAANVHRIEGELPPEEAAARYEAELRNALRLEGAEVPVFDLLMLGMGDDGHTASLFPHTEALHEFMRLAVANRVPQKDTWRVTLTSPVINRARHVVFLIAGADKAAPLSHVMQGPYQPETYPAQLIRPTGGKLTLLLDESAAANLPPAHATADGARTGTLEVQR